MGRLSNKQFTHLAQDVMHSRGLPGGALVLQPASECICVCVWGAGGEVELRSKAGRHTHSAARSLHVYIKPFCLQESGSLGKAYGAQSTSNPSENS